jgi:hypothetical protein
MREIRLSGSEGGGAELNQPSLPLSCGLSRSSSIHCLWAFEEAKRWTASSAWTALPCPKMLFGVFLSLGAG